jgi:hypothetical protein
MPFRSAIIFLDLQISMANVQYRTIAVLQKEGSVGDDGKSDNA